MSEDVRALTEMVKKESAFVDDIVHEVGKVIVGQEKMVERALIGILTGGHVLLEGVPGLAKTLTVNTLCRAISAKFQRIQFTPDLLPADLVGTVIYNQNSGQFSAKKGPIFANFILADEINRAPAKVQSALLEAMQEYHVTAGGNTYELDLPFFVLATQNPIEQEGTYPLPEAQQDRFMFMVSIDYPSRDEERLIVKTTTSDVKGEPEAVLSAEDILALQKIVRKIPISQHVIDYAVNLTRATRPSDPTAPEFVKNYLAWGAGPRAAQYLVLGAKSRALLHGRFNVGSDDVRAVAKPVLRHRIFTNFNADAEGLTADNIVEMLVKAVGEPKSDDYKDRKGARHEETPRAPLVARPVEDAEIEGDVPKAIPVAQPVPPPEAEPDQPAAS